ncbi:type IV toxin-antitoxin system AbiEi family antitoxin [Desulfoplanes sp.]
MQPIRQLSRTLEHLAGPKRYLFTLSDLKAALPALSASAFKTLVSRVEKQGLLQRICRGLYLYPGVDYPAGLVLFHAAARLRAGFFNYLSLESVLSDAGVISQVMMNWITVMSSGRSNCIDCGSWGHIECIHTEQRPEKLAPHLTYDPRIHLWRASIPQALEDMRRTRRSMDLIDWEVAHESI